MDGQYESSWMMGTDAFFQALKYARRGTLQGLVVSKQYLDMGLRNVDLGLSEEEKDEVYGRLGRFLDGVYDENRQVLRDQLLGYAYHKANSEEWGWEGLRGIVEEAEEYSRTEFEKLGSTLHKYVIKGLNFWNEIVSSYEDDVVEARVLEEERVRGSRFGSDVAKRLEASE